MVTSNIDVVTYIFSLKRIKGIGDKSIMTIVDKYPSHDSLLDSSSQELEHNFGRKISDLIQFEYKEHLPSVQEESNEILSNIRHQGMKIVTFISEDYPPFLKLIEDPPSIIYAIGEEQLLQSKKTIAVIGTRNPTNLGMEISFRIASNFAQKGFIIVSGLAKGIDTEAHKGALSVDGQTIAVLGTALDKIYPAENRGLAERITRQSGLLISEIEPGRGSRRSAFVRRNRIQSGISLGIIAVQSDISGGTMHTVRFAQQQGRLIFVPKPIRSEENEKQNRGIQDLIESKEAAPFTIDDYEVVASKLEEHLDYLMEGEKSSRNTPDSNDGDYTQLSMNNFD